MMSTVIMIIDYFFVPLCALYFRLFIYCVAFLVFACWCTLCMIRRRCDNDDDDDADDGNDGDGRILYRYCFLHSVVFCGHKGNELLAHMIYMHAVGFLFLPLLLHWPEIRFVVHFKMPA